MKRLVVIIALILLNNGITVAQESNEKGKRGLPESLFSPQLIIDSKNEIVLTPDQLKNIEEQARQLEKETQTIGQQVKVESDKLLKLLLAPKVNEADSTVIIYRILDLERQLRIDETLYLIKLKNLLTEAQQKQLTEIRSKQAY
ncbi:MAG: hypothetical protein ACRENZ_03800 [Thermodesulfobacteriota bacterium]